MGLPSFFAFLLLFHLVLLLVLLHLAEAAGNVSEPSCPPSFDCGNHDQISFPFANNTYTTCGLVTVNCDKENLSIALGGKQYDVVSPWLQGSPITLFDRELQHQIDDGESCDFFHNSSLPQFPSNHFKILHNLTLFKCSIGHQFEWETENYFVDYSRDTRCRNYTLYYKNTIPPAPIPSSLPPNCAVIQMPVSPPNLYKNPNNLNEVLAQFSLELNVLDACNVCRQRRGRCHENFPFWQCETATQEKAEGPSQYQTDQHRGETKNFGLILGTGASATGLLIAIVLFCFFRKKCSSRKSMIFWKTKTGNHLDVEGFLKNCRYLATNRYNYSDVKKMTNSFKEKLGQGGYGSVYKGKLHNGCLVAVKVLSESKGNGEEFINEVASISRTSHVNIVTLLGFCFEGRKRALIYEFMPNGSLEKFIYNEKSSKERQLGWETLYQIAVGIAQGLEYLHRGCNTRILHFDIKPHNILLDEDFCPKISDFGLAKLCPEKDSIISMLGTRGTAGFIAPEVFCRNFGGISHKSDVYSYGMMILEMAGGRKNIDVGVDHTSEIYFPHWIYKCLELDEEIELCDIRNEKDNENARKMIIVGLWCIQTDPSNRPAMSSVVDMLKGSLESLQIPPKPFLSSPSRPPADSSST